MEDLRKLCICLATGILCVLNCSASDSETASMSHYSASDDDSNSDKSITALRRSTTVTVSYIEHKEEIIAEEEEDFRGISPSSSLLHKGALTLSYNLPSLEPTPPTKIVLTIDGGGSRGIIPLFFFE